jgi:dienelactone hydrolase
MNVRTTVLAGVLIGMQATLAAADGPADNMPSAVRRVPKLGIDVSAADRKELEAGLAELAAAVDQLKNRRESRIDSLLPDVRIFYRAVHDALAYQEFFAPNEIKKAHDLLKEGTRRAAQLAQGSAPWASQTGLVVRGYESRIDGSVQPYGLVIPESYSAQGGKVRLDLWFHGRGENLSEVNFLDERRRSQGEFAPADTIVLHPYGRYCNAFKFAGEVDVLEALESVQRRYRIDDDRISVRGFSMGGAACWQFAVHYADRWFAANPGAGFAETPQFLKVFQRETLTPPPYERTLWHMYDCNEYAANLLQCPTVAYSGALDSQKQAADVMAEALKKEEIDLVHIIGPGTRHAYHPDAKREVERRLASLARKGRESFPEEINLVTYTLKYNKMNWVTIDGLGEHWKKAWVHAEFDHGPRLEVDTQNVTALTFEFPAGAYPFGVKEPVNLILDGVGITGPRPGSDRSWSVSLHQERGEWVLGRAGSDTVQKRHDLQGPIDDAFMDSFIIVRPTGKSPHAKFQAWCDAERDRAVEHWRRHFRGDARVKDDTAIGDADVASANLVLWGDPASNAVLKRIADRLPLKWSSQAITVSGREFPADSHALVMVYPNPLNPKRYIVLNSGFTFRDYDYLNNARQVPKLPDWAVINLSTPPDARYPGKVAAADFFDEAWQVRAEQKPQNAEAK